jgi:hypothetical protein
MFYIINMINILNDQTKFVVIRIKLRGLSSIQKLQAGRWKKIEEFAWCSASFRFPQMRFGNYWPCFWVGTVSECAPDWHSVKFVCKICRSISQQSHLLSLYHTCCYFVRLEFLLPPVPLHAYSHTPTAQPTLAMPARQPKHTKRTVGFISRRVRSLSAPIKIYSFPYCIRCAYDDQIIPRVRSDTSLLFQNTQKTRVCIIFGLSAGVRSVSQHCEISVLRSFFNISLPHRRTTTATLIDLDWCGGIWSGPARREFNFCGMMSLWRINNFTPRYLWRVSQRLIVPLFEAVRRKLSDWSVLRISQHDTLGMFGHLK